MKRRHFFVRILTALGFSTVSSSALHPTPVLVHEGSEFPILPAAVGVDVPPWIRHWRSLPKSPVWESSHPTVARLIRAAEQSHRLKLTYRSGTMPGEARFFSPAEVFRAGNSAILYVSGWCHHRQANRCLRADFIALDFESSLSERNEDTEN